jgi:hypothetical protein
MRRLIGTGVLSNPRLALAVAVLIAAPVKAPAGSDGILNISSQEFLSRYLGWAHEHPAAYEGQPRINAQIPAIDLYSAAGVLLYYGGDSEKNAAFLRALPRSAAEAKTSAMRPTLQETLALFPEFGAPPAGMRYAVLATTYPDWDKCKAQNDAIEELKARARKMGIWVLELRLHR